MANGDTGIALSLAHLSELDVPPAHLMRLAATAGFASVGFRTHPAAPGGIVYPLTTAGEQTEIRRLTAETGVGVQYVELISLSEKTRAADHRSVLEIGAAIGAERLAVAGDSTNFDVVAEKLAEIADLARAYGLAVDLEFMPFRAVKSFTDAVDVVRRAGRPNAHVLVDALHVFRSGSALADIAACDPALIGTFQICDAPAAAPPPDHLVTEARTRRMLPGDGGLALRSLIDVLPDGVAVGAEVPLAASHPNLTPGERLALLARSVKTFLNQRRTA